MANFTLTWDPNISGGVITQQAEYRRKSVGGSYTSTGFSPANPLSNSASTTSISGLLDNVVYEFRIGNLCSGSDYNYMPVLEAIKFACVSPSESHTDTTLDVVVSGLPSDILRVIATLYDSTGTTVIAGPLEVTTSGGAVDIPFTSLTPSTTYLAKIQIVANVNGQDITSSFSNCQITITTDGGEELMLINGSDSLTIDGSDFLLV